MIKNKKVILFLSQSIGEDDDDRNLYNILSFIDNDRYKPIIYIMPEIGSTSHLQMKKNRYDYKPEDFINLFNNRYGIQYERIVKINFVSKLLTMMRNKLAYMNTAIFRLPLIILKEKAEIIYCCKPALLMVAVIAGLITCVSVICHVRSFTSGYSNRRLKILSFLPIVEKFIFSSESLKERYSVNAKKSTVIYDGIDTADFRRPLINGQLRETYHISSASVVFGTYGRLMPGNGLLSFIRAGKITIEACPCRDIRLVIMSRSVLPEENKYLEQVKQLAEDLGISKYVIFIENVSDIRSFLVDLDILVIPYFYPLYSAYLLLAGMALSLPIAAYDTESIPEFVINEHTGLLYKTGDYINLGKGMIQMIKHKYIRVLMGEAGRERIEKYFDVLMKTWEIEDVL